MKRTMTLLTITLLAGIFLYACGIIPNSTTSFVTIRIGDRPGTAVLQAEAATPWARMKHVLAGVKLMPEAQAYIPSVVQVIVVTVTASDISTPIVGVDNIKDTDTIATIRIEVPNGASRQFLVEGYRGLPSGATQLFYSGTATANLTGADIGLPVDMTLVGPGIWVNNQHPSAADIASCGTTTQPCLTIAYALRSRTSGTDAVLVSAGTYLPVGAGGSESFPLQLRPNTALVCTGTGFSTVVDLLSLSTTAVYGNDGASIDNCLFRINNSGGGGIAITDAIGGQPGQQSRIRVNGVYIELGGFPTGLANIGVIFNDDSLLLDSSVTGSAAGGSLSGVQVSGGRPDIIGNRITNLPFGIRLETGAGDALVTANTISGNQTGINITTTARPTVSSNMITNTFQNGTGISISSGNALITGNTIQGNNTGISVGNASPEITGNEVFDNWLGISIATSSGAPRVNGNSIFCNPSSDVFVNDPQGTLVVFDLRNNAWDHAATTNPPGPIVDSFANNGADIFVSSPTRTPDYAGAQAVPNGCLPYPVPVGKPMLR